MSAFFAMDGYAAFVWPAYALTFAGVAGLIGLAITRRKQAEARLKHLEAEEARP
jgi:heme exporter protein CcmD